MQLKVALTVETSRDVHLQYDKILSRGIGNPG